MHLMTPPETDAGFGRVPRADRSGRPVARAILSDVELGTLVATWTARGLCGVSFSDRDPKPAPDRGSVAVQHVDDGVPELGLADFCAHLRSPANALRQPLDEMGTAFQCRVWAALRAIPPGETYSYAAVARSLGRPTAARAVAAACAANPLAIATPCHRVVRHDGGLAGYRWGVWRKHVLLAREQEACATTSGTGQTPA